MSLRDGFTSRGGRRGASPTRSEASGYAADDCDDADPAVHPGAEEWCDAADWNCDGDPYDGGACGEAQDLGVLADGTWDGDTGRDLLASGHFLGDLDGDGDDEIGLVGGGLSDSTAPAAYGGVYYIPGGQPLSMGMSHTGEAAAWWHGNVFHSSLGATHPAGDVDGDGQADLWLLGFDDQGGAALMFGPPERWGLDQDYIDASDVLGLGAADIRATRVRGAADEIRVDCMGQYDVAAGDLTGDGTPGSAERRQLGVAARARVPGARRRPPLGRCRRLVARGFRPRCARPGETPPARLRAAGASWRSGTRRSSCPIRWRIGSRGGPRGLPPGPSGARPRRPGPRRRWRRFHPYRRLPAPDRRRHPARRHRRSGRSQASPGSRCAVQPSETTVSACQC